jgi:hypothetical protein
MVIISSLSFKTRPVGAAQADDLWQAQVVRVLGLRSHCDEVSQDHVSDCFFVGIESGWGRVQRKVEPGVNQA